MWGKTSHSLSKIIIRQYNSYRMSKVWKNVAATLGLVAVSVVASATTVHVMKNGTPSGRASSEVSGTEATLSASDYGFQNAALSVGQRPIGSAPDLTPAAEASVKAVVHIKVQKEQRVEQQQMMDPFEFFFGGDPRNSSRRSQPVVGYGSGVIISNDGYIMTNNHVVDGGDEIKVTLNDNRTFKAKLVGADSGSDIALLKIEGSDFPTIPFGNSDNLRLGEWVLAVGNPFNLTSTVTAGIVSAKSRAAATGDQLGVGAFIQTDAAVNPGNSGGALVNAAGELVGINTMIYSQTGNYAGYSFAVPINIAAKVVSDIKKYGTVQRGMLGVAGADVTSELVQKEGLKVNEGFYVADFAEISAALAAGIEKGDVITAIDGHRITSFAQLQEQLSRFRPGDAVQVTVNRKGAEKTYKVTLRNQEGGSKLLKQSPNGANNRLGATLKELGANELRAYGLSYGLVVQSLQSNSALRKAGVREGFVLLTANNVPLRSQSDLNQVVAALDKAGSQSRSRRSALQLRGFYPETGEVVSFVVDL